MHNKQIVCTFLSQYIDNNNRWKLFFSIRVVHKKIYNKTTKQFRSNVPSCNSANQHNIHNTTIKTTAIYCVSFQIREMIRLRRDNVNKGQIRVAKWKWNFMTAINNYRCFTLERILNRPSPEKTRPSGQRCVLKIFWAYILLQGCNLYRLFLHFKS